MSEPGWTQHPRGSRGQSPPRPQRYDRSGGDGLPYKAALTMGEVEERIMRADDELAELTGIHMNLAEEAAMAESTWKRHRDTVIVRIVKGEDRSASDYREAAAREEIDPITTRPGHELYEDYKVTKARSDSSARAMRAIESRLNAFQTIAANLRRASMS